MHGWHDVLFCISGTEQVDAIRDLQPLSLLYGETVIGIDEGHAMNMNGIDLASPQDNTIKNNIVIP